MKIPTTPQRWLLWTHDEITNDVITRATATAIHPLSIMEAHAAIALLVLSGAGTPAIPISAISSESGHKVQTSLMDGLRKFGHVEAMGKLNGAKCTSWKITVKGRTDIGAMQARIEALIARARPLDAANALIDRR